jgi:CP family cyanate transporter-like MFS transporter
VPEIERDLALSGAAAGLLTALPVLCMGVFAPLAQRLAHVIGREGAVLWALVALAAGSLLRLGGTTTWLLYAGTLVTGIGIAIGGTLLPGIVKEFFARRVGAVTGCTCSR